MRLILTFAVLKWLTRELCMKTIDINKKYRNTNTSYQMSHYTSLEGLLNIVSNKRLRFTDCTYLNDIEEFNYIKKVLEKCFMNDVDSKLRRIIEKLVLDDFKEDNNDYLFMPNKGKISMKEAKYYVLSGSVECDELPMWVYYSKSEGYRGYSVNIDIDELIKQFDGIEGLLLHGLVEYDFNRQVEIIESCIRAFNDEYEMKAKPFKGKTDEDSVQSLDILIDEFQESLFDLIRKMRLFFKSADFKHEKEYRIAILVRPDDNKIKKTYFVKNGVIVPCASVELEENLPINSVIVGPTMEFELANIGLRDLFINYHVKNANKISITKSKIRVRY